MPTIKGLPTEVADEKAVSFIQATGVADGDTIDTGLSVIDAAVAQCHNAADVAQISALAAPDVTIDLLVVADGTASANTPDVTVIAIGER